MSSFHFLNIYRLLNSVYLWFGTPSSRPKMVSEKQPIVYGHTTLNAPDLVWKAANLLNLIKTFNATDQCFSF